jgi:surface carbohydrate biosynthesis protein (TIGR04326 family)
MNQIAAPATAPACVLLVERGDGEAAPRNNGEVWSWSHYSDGDRSVPEYLEQHAEHLRSRYLSFIHDLGETPVNGLPLVEHLAMRDGFSFWWMTLLAEKSPLKSPRIYDVLRVLALEDMLKLHKPAKLVLRSVDQPLIESVRSVCSGLGIAFESESKPSIAPRLSLRRRLYRKLPYPLQGLAVISRQLIRHWPLRKLKPPEWFTGPDAIFFCSYFVHLDAVSCANGEFLSHQWEQLPTHMQEMGRRANWLQHFLFSPAVPNTATGIEWIGRFNRDGERQGRHAFVDTYLCPSVVFSAMSMWIRLNIVSLRLRRLHAAFQPAGSAASLWPLLKHDWFNSVRGTVAAGNCLSLALFERALKSLPRQQTGLYIFENQGWERAFLHAWKLHGHGEIIGVQHATAPFWHLYYFDDPRSLRRDGPHAMPQADRFAVNGAAAYKAFIEAGYCPQRVVEVEALRYLGLASIARRCAVVASRPASSPLRVLILGDMIESSMQQLLTMVEGAAIAVGDMCRFTFKPHPYFPVVLARYPALTTAMTAEPLHRVLPEFDVAIAANSTSAAVDAYIAGLAVIVGLDGATLNLSPLRGQPGVGFASDAASLTAALRALQQQLADDANTALAKQAVRDNFFCLNPSLSRWTDLLTRRSVGLIRPKISSFFSPIPQ